VEHGQLLRSAPGSSLAWARAVLSRWRIGAAPQCAIISSAGNTRPLTAFRRCTLRGHGRQSRTQNVAGENRPSIALWGAGRGLATPRFSPGIKALALGLTHRYGERTVSALLRGVDSHVGVAARNDERPDAK
jgi:hypothetical protein